MTYYFRVDSSFKIGAGHIKRCIRLADQLDAKNVEFICKDLDGNLNNIIKKKYKLHLINNKSWQIDLSQTIRIINNNNNNNKILFVDNYEIGKSWEKKIKRYVKKIIVIDDIPRKHYCDYLINPNWYFQKNKLFFKNYKNCKNLMFGPNYSLINYNNINTRKKSSQLSIFFGGSDNKNITLFFLKKITSLISFKINVIILNKKKKDVDLIKNYLKTYKNKKIKLFKNLNSLSKIFQNTRFFVGASGSTTWERLLYKIPSLIISTTNDQKNINKGLSKNKLQISLSFSDLNSKSNLKRKIQQLILDEKKLIQRQRNLIDGKGLLRIKLALSSFDKKDVGFKHASEEDFGFLFFCINQPIAIKSRFKSTTIALDEHRKWFNNILKSSRNFLFMITVKDINVGFIRYDLFNNYFAIDIYIENIFSERGVSRIVMSKTMHHMKKKTGVKIFRAYVKKKNLISINFFKSLKFNYNQSYFEKKI